MLNYKIESNELEAKAVAGVRGKNKLPGEDIISEYNYPGYALQLEC